jgi:hypothetical protein
LVLVLELEESLDLMVVSRMVRTPARRCTRRGSPPLEWGAATAVLANSTLLKRVKENFIMNAIDALKELKEYEMKLIRKIDSSRPEKRLKVAGGKRLP